MHRSLGLSFVVSIVLGACRPSQPLPVHVDAADAGTAAVPPSSRVSASPKGDAGLEAEATVVLPIPARAQAAESPAEGWCGETAIQEALFYFGVSASQREINRAGRPLHPDLYATEIPVALRALGVRFTPYGRAKGYEAFARWAREAIDAGEPVLAGVKLLPTQHPTWGLDHFVLIVGYGPRGLLVNTTWGHRTWVADASTGMSLKDAFYGLRLHGIAR